MAALIRRRVKGLAGMILLVGITLAWSQSGPGGTRHAFEYKVVDESQLSPRWDALNYKATLNQMGGDGWELCGVVTPVDPQNAKEPVYYFKREIP